MTEGIKKWYAIEYAGFWNINDSDDYCGNSVFDCTDVGAEAAMENAKLAASAPELLEQVKSLQKRIKELENREGEFAKWITNNKWFWNEVYQEWFKYEIPLKENPKTTSKLLKEYEEYLKTL